MILRFESFLSFQNGPKPIIDRQAGILANVCAMHEGEALGHGIEADLQTLVMMAQLGNANPKGIRGRFGHPAMSENATGKQVQVASDFYVSGGKLLHRSRLLDSARKSPVFTQDPVEFILELAENNPTEFGESVVVNTDLVWTLEDGSERPLNDDELNEVGYGLKAPNDATNNLPLMRPTEFHYVDFVNEGALTHDGLFSSNNADMLAGFNSIFAPGKSSYFAKEIFQFLDDWRNAYKINLNQLQDFAPKKVNQIIRAYIAHRSKNNKETFTMSKKVTQEESITDEFESGPAVETTQDEGDITADLAETDAIMNELESGLSEESENERNELLAVIADMQANIGQHHDALRSELEAIRSHIRDLSKALVGQARLLQIQDKRIKALSGERVLTQAVARSPQTTVEELAQNGAFSFETGPAPANKDLDQILGNDETQPAQIRGRDLSTLAWQNRRKVDSGQ